MTRPDSSNDQQGSSEAFVSDKPLARLRDPGGISQILRRRRLIVIPAVILIIAGVAFAIVAEGPKYKVTARVVVLSPPSPPVNESGTPIERTDAGKTDNSLTRTDQSVVVSIVAGMINTEAERARLVDAGAEPDYEVEGFGGPVADISAASHSAAKATKSVRLVREAFVDNLAKLQADQGIDPAYAITTLPLEEPTDAGATRSGTIRLAVVITCAVLVVAGVAMWILEARLRPRRRKDHVGDRSMDSTETVDVLAERHLVYDRPGRSSEPHLVYDRPGRSSEPHPPAQSPTTGVIATDYSRPDARSPSGLDGPADVPRSTASDPGIDEVADVKPAPGPSEDMVDDDMQRMISRILAGRNADGEPTTPS